MSTAITAVPSTSRVDAGASAPTIADARRAAAVLRDAGAKRVILFGSVGRGDQSARSDLDLAAIFDDIDYRRRAGLSAHLEQMVVDATGFPCDVLVSDFIEWERSVSGVPTALRSVVEQHGQVLVDGRGAPGCVDKEMVIPVTRQDEAHARLRDAGNRLFGAVGELEKGASAELGPARFADQDRKTIHLDQLNQLHRATECAMKALLAQHGDSPPRVHNTETLEGRLPSPHRERVVALRGGLPHRYIRYWSVESQYEDMLIVETDTDLPTLVRRLGTVAVAIVNYATDEFEDAYGSTIDTERVRYYGARVEALLPTVSTGPNT